MAPIFDAAEGRASQLNQSPVGGLLDVATIGAAGPMEAVARRVIAPRIASTAAVGTDLLSKGAAMAPKGAQRVSSEAMQYLLPNVMEETSVDKAKRINMERKMMKGGM